MKKQNFKNTVFETSYKRTGWDACYASGLQGAKKQERNEKLMRNNEILSKFKTKIFKLQQKIEEKVWRIEKNEYMRMC